MAPAAQPGETSVVINWAKKERERDLKCERPAEPAVLAHDPPIWKTFGEEVLVSIKRLAHLRATIP